MKTGKVIGNIAAITLGVVAGLGTAAAVGAIIGFKKWAKDDDSDCMRIVIGNARGIRISKTDEKDKYEFETNYDWQSDPDFYDCDNCGNCCDCDCCEDAEDRCCCVEITEDKKAEEADASDASEPSAEI